MIKYLPERLREMRLKQKISQKDAARLLNVSPSLISSYESGERTPSADMLLSISYLYKCSTDFLLGKEEKSSLSERIDTQGLNEEEIRIIKDLISVMKRNRI